MPESKKTLDESTLKSWLWEAACKIRGADDAPKFKDYILPLIFLKRLSDVFDDEIAHLAKDFGGVEKTQKIVDGQHQLVRFYIPNEARWDVIKTKTTGLGEHLTDAMRKVGRINPRLHGAIDVVDFNATYADQRIIDDHRLANLVQVLSRYRLGLDDVEPDILGRSYEYLLGKFAEGSGKSAGEFYTPKEVGILMARILEPEPGMEVYDPCCGSGGLLIKCHLRLIETHGKKYNGRLTLPDDVAPLKLYGQEQIPATFAIARMNTVIHDMEATIAPGDTMRNPAFKEDDGSLRQFDIVTANPMWNDDNYGEEFYESDGYGRFRYGLPSKRSADWGWLQHMLASLRDTGRMAVVLDTGSVSRKTSIGEYNTRKAFVDADLVEAVILLPENMFYNTQGPGLVIVINRRKRNAEEILLVNASKMFERVKPKNKLSDEHVAQIARIYHKWEEREGTSVVVAIQQVVAKDYNLSPSKYVATNDVEPVLPPEEAMVELEEAEEERTEVDKKLREVFRNLGLR